MKIGEWNGDCNSATADCSLFTSVSCFFGTALLPFPDSLAQNKLNLPVYAPKLILRPAFEFFQRVGINPKDKCFFF